MTIRLSTNLFQCPTVGTGVPWQALRIGVQAQSGVWSIMFWVAFLGLGIGVVLLSCATIAPFVAALGPDNTSDPGGESRDERQDEQDSRQLLLFPY